MPELPEVETVCRSLRPHLVGRTIRRVRVLEPRLRLPVDDKALQALAGKRIDAITRTGLSYCPEMKFRMIVSRSASAASVSR